jgi:phage tail protein X
MRSQNVSRHLTLDDAVQIWRRRIAGEAQHVLAAEYYVNPGRIAEVLAGKRFPHARAIALGDNAAVDAGT